MEVGRTGGPDVPCWAMGTLGKSSVPDGPDRLPGHGTAARLGLPTHWGKCETVNIGKKVCSHWSSWKSSPTGRSAFPRSSGRFASGLPRSGGKRKRTRWPRRAMLWLGEQSGQAVLLLPGLCLVPKNSPPNSKLSITSPSHQNIKYSK